MKDKQWEQMEQPRKGSESQNGTPQPPRGTPVPPVPQDALCSGETYSPSLSFEVYVKLILVPPPPFCVMSEVQGMFPNISLYQENTIPCLHGVYCLGGGCGQRIKQRTKLKRGDLLARTCAEGIFPRANGRWQEAKMSGRWELM